MSEALDDQKPLPVGSAGRKSSGWWGVWLLIITEGSLFGYLLLSYYYLWAQTKNQWPPEGLPSLTLPSINTALLLSSSVFVWLAERSMRQNKLRGTVIWLFIAIIAGAAFIGVQWHEWEGKNYGLTTHLYGSLYFTITGFHLLHVLIGLIALGVLAVWSGLGYFSAQRCEALTIGSMYWHFVDVVWLLSASNPISGTNLVAFRSARAFLHMPAIRIKPH